LFLNLPVAAPRQSAAVISAKVSGTLPRCRYALASQFLRAEPLTYCTYCRKLAQPPAPASLSPATSMNAQPLLNSVVAALAAVRLEVILIGNAAAAIQGAPVTTVDFDFMFRATSVNLAKLKKFAVRLDAVILRPYYPASALFRVMNDDRGLQADFMPAIHGVKSFNSLRSRAEKIQLGANRLWVAHLADIIASKRAAGRARDKAVLDILEKTLREKSKSE